MKECGIFKQISKLKYQEGIDEVFPSL